MKYALFSLAIFLLAVSSIYAQSEEDIAPVLSDTFSIVYNSIDSEKVIYEMFDIDQPPRYPGGEKELLKYLAENIKYPVENRENNIISMVAIAFIVEPDGSISTKKIVRNDGAFAQSILRIIDQMPSWSPGMRNGQPVAVWFTLPIRVCLGN